MSLMADGVASGCGAGADMASASLLFLMWKGNGRWLRG